MVVFSFLDKLPTQHLQVFFWSCVAHTPVTPQILSTSLGSEFKKSYYATLILLIRPVLRKQFISFIIWATMQLQCSPNSKPKISFLSPCISAIRTYSNMLNSDSQGYSFILLTSTNSSNFPWMVKMPHFLWSLIFSWTIKEMAST